MFILASDVDVRGLVLVKQIVKLVVSRLHSIQLLLVVLHVSVIVTMGRVVLHYNVLVADVGRALLIALVVAECH